MSDNIGKKYALEDHIVRDYDMLRKELKDINTYQSTLFTFSITATAAFYGLTSVLISSNQSLIGIIFLAPLIVLLPAWTMFLDKFSTNSRIVGYLRVLELIFYADMDVEYHYIGWERALEVIRSYPDENFDAPKGFKHLLLLPKILNVRKYRYGLNVYRIYLMLSILSIVLATATMYWQSLVTKTPFLTYNILIPVFAALIVLYYINKTLKQLYFTTEGTGTFEMRERKFIRIMNDAISPKDDVINPKGNLTASKIISDVLTPVPAIQDNALR
jgi:hypothetical protein